MALLPVQGPIPTRYHRTHGALIDVDVASSTSISHRASADGMAADGVGVAHGVAVARVANAGVVQVAEDTCQACISGKLSVCSVKFPPMHTPVGETIRVQAQLLNVADYQCKIIS